MVTQEEILNLIGSNEGIVQSTLTIFLNGEPGNINHAIMRLSQLLRPSGAACSSEYNARDD